MTEEEVSAQIQKYLGEPLFFPDAFKKWLTDWAATNIPQIPITQVLGFSMFQPQSASVSANEATTAANPVDLATRGPEITGLADGQYLVFHGCSISAATSTLTIGFETLTINDVTAGENTGNRGQVNPGQWISVMRADKVTMQNNDNNGIRMQYGQIEAHPKVAFLNRWMLVLRLSSA